jgi:drug/metabolite transporter (DMT)-like permease
MGAVLALIAAVSYGVGDFVGGVLLATGVGQLTVAAVLAGLYPAITVALAAIVLHERIQRVQTTGLIAAAGAVVLIVTAA